MFKYSVTKLYVANRDDYWTIPGDTVMVTKGRKIPVGTVDKIDHLYIYRNYNSETVYAVFPDGRKTNINNVVMVLNLQ